MSMYIPKGHIYAHPRKDMTLRAQMLMYLALESQSRKEGAASLAQAQVLAPIPGGYLRLWGVSGVWLGVACAFPPVRDMF